MADPLVFFMADRSYAMLPEPRPCPGGCRTMTMFVVNYRGSSLCLACDGKRDGADALRRAAACR